MLKDAVFSEVGGEQVNYRACVFSEVACNHVSDEAGKTHKPCYTFVQSCILFIRWTNHLCQSQKEEMSDECRIFENETGLSVD